MIIRVLNDQIKNIINAYKNDYVKCIRFDREYPYVKQCTNFPKNIILIIIKYAIEFESYININYIVKPDKFTFENSITNGSMLFVNNNKNLSFSKTPDERKEAMTQYFGERIKTLDDINFTNYQCYLQFVFNNMVIKKATYNFNIVYKFEIKESYSGKISHKGIAKSFCVSVDNSILKYTCEITDNVMRNNNNKPSYKNNHNFDSGLINHKTNLEKFDNFQLLLDLNDPGLFGFGKILGIKFDNNVHENSFCDSKKVYKTKYVIKNKKMFDELILINNNIQNVLRFQLCSLDK